MTLLKTPPRWDGEYYIPLWHTTLAIRITISSNNTLPLSSSFLSANLLNIASFQFKEYH